MKYSSALFALVLAVCNSYGQVSLPYFQDFEEVTDSTYTEATTSIAGLPFFSFEKADNSNNVIVGFQKGQEGSKGIDLRGDDEDVTSNGLILTLDLSDRDTLNDDILLNLLVNLSCFNAAFEGGGPCGQQKLFIRGSDSDDWMFFYDMNPLWRNLSTFTPLQYASLTDSLKANQQNFSSTTQIKIFSSGLSFRMDELEVFERPAQDIKLFSVSSPQPRFGLSNSEEVTVQVTNLGSDTEADLPITLQVNGPMGMQEIDKVLSSPLNKNDTAQVIFDQVDMSLIGNYDIVAFSGLSEDNDPSNDTISGYSIHRDRFTGDLPFFEDFNDMTAGAVYIEKSAALPTIDGFSYQSSDQNGRLYVSQRSDNPENLFLGLGRRSDLLGNMLISNELILTLDLSNYLAADDELLLDFSFYFESVFVDFNQDNRVFVRGSQDEEWLELYDWFENRPESPFNLKTIREMNISDTLLANGQDFSDTFQLLFRENNNFGRSVVYIDNIAVYERKNIDLQLLSTDAFQPAVHPIADTISILAYNFGKDSIPNIPVNVQVTGQGLDTLIQSTVMQSVAGGDSITLEINHDLNLDQVGFYDITTFHSLDGDEDRSNDTVRYTTYKRDLSNASLPIELAFTELPFDTIQSLIAPSVEGIPGFSYSTDSEFGVHGIANTVFNRTTSKAFFMENNQTFGSTIFSELIYSLDLSSYDVQNNDLLLSITSGFRSSFSFTDNRLWIRGSEEDPWISFFDLFENRYENTDYLSISDRLKDADQNFSGTFQIRFRLEQMRRSAFFLKDLSIYERPENDVQVVTIIKPDDQTVFGNSENIGIRVNNQGKSTITSLPLNLEVRGPVDTVLLSQSFDTNLSSLDTIEYIFSGLDLSRDGYYDILVYSSLEGDPNQLYDTLRTGIKNLQVNPGNLPYVEGFELPSSGVRFRNSNFQINGLSGWSVENGSVQSRTEWQTEGQQSLGISGQSSAALLTIDLSEYQVEQNEIMMEFDFTRSSTSGSGLISVRGSENHEWLPLFDWGIVLDQSFEWISSGPVSLTDTLARHGQDLSSTTQIRFFNQGNFRTFLLDNFQLYAPIDSIDSGRSQAVEFAIDGIGYFGLGTNGLEKFSDFYQMDNITNSFSPIAPFPGLARSEAVAFVVGDKAYVGLGQDQSGNYLSDFYQYDPVLNEWSPMADFEGGGRADAVAFAIDEFGYVGTGINDTDEQKDFWKYDPATNDWTPIADFSADKRRGAFAFVLGDRAYVGGGFNFDGFQFQLSDIQEYNPATDSWTEKIFADGINLSVNDAAAFSLYGYGFIAYGNKSNIIQYNPITNQVENLGDVFELGDRRNDPIAFALGDSAVFGLGSYSSFPTLYANTFNTFFLANEKPSDLSLSNQSIAENSEPGSLVGAISVTDSDELFDHSYDLVSGDGIVDADNASFAIEDGRLVTSESFNFEEKSIYSVYIQAKDSRGDTVKSTFQIDITNANDAPTDLALIANTVFESVSDDTVLLWAGSLQLTDEDENDIFNYDVVPGDGSNDVDNDRFSITSNLLYIANPNFEEKSTYIVNIKGSDLIGESITKSFEVEVLDVNDPPSDILLSNVEVLENAPIATFIGSLTTIDEDDTIQADFSYEIQNDFFNQFDTNEGNLITQSELRDIQTDSNYDIAIVSRDSKGSALKKDFTISVLFVLGLDEKSDFAVYPNPVEDILQIRFGRTLSQNVLLKVHTLDGKSILSRTMDLNGNKVNLDVSTIEQGTYILEIMANDQKISKVIYKK